jgi:hypothetical protein
MIPPAIITASWFTPLPTDCLRIGISRSAPRRTAAGYRMERRLAPGPWFSTASTPDYLRLFAAILAGLDPLAIAADLAAMAGPGRRAALLCYEPAGQFCHRSLVAAWLSEAIGQLVPEIGFEHLAQHQHPCLPPADLLMTNYANCKAIRSC